MIQKKKDEGNVTNEALMKCFSSQFALAITAMRMAVHMIKSGKAADDGVINVAVHVLDKLLKDKTQSTHVA